MTEVPINQFKFMPELAIVTDTTDLPEEGAQRVRLKSISGINQYVAPLEYANESIADVLIQHDIDGVKPPELDSSSMRDFTDRVNTFVEKDSAFAFVFNDYRMNANNNVGAAQPDYITRLKYMVKELTTSRKEFNGRPLSNRDRAAKEILAANNILNVDQVIQTSEKLPANVKTGLNDANIGSFQRAFGGSLNLVTNQRAELANINIEAGTVAVLTELAVTVPAQADAGEVSIFISRDDDTDLYNFDPVALGVNQISIPLFTPAYQELKVEVLQTSGVHNGFKAYAGVSVKNVGLFHKAKLQEFSPDFVPDQVAPSPAEEQIITDLNLRELARVGAQI